jgi:hypothetical protein
VQIRKIVPLRIHFTAAGLTACKFFRVEQFEVEDERPKNWTQEARYISLCSDPRSPDVPLRRKLFHVEQFGMSIPVRKRAKLHLRRSHGGPQTHGGRRSSEIVPRGTILPRGASTQLSSLFTWIHKSFWLYLLISSLVASTQKFSTTPVPSCACRPSQVPRLETFHNGPGFSTAQRPAQNRPRVLT